MNNPLRDATYPALPGPFNPPPSPKGIRLSNAVSKLAETQARALLESSPAFYELPPERQTAMRRDLEKIASYTAALIQDEWAASKKLGQTPVLREQTTVSGPLAEAESAPVKALA